MSDLFRCLSCGGTYADRNSDGTVYFHACPPLVDKRTGNPVDREDARNENLKLNRRRQSIGILAEGKGVEPVFPTKAAEPAWLTQHKARWQKEQNADAR